MQIIGTFGPNGPWFATTNPDGTPIFTLRLPAPLTPSVSAHHLSAWLLKLEYGSFQSVPDHRKRGIQFRAESYNVWNQPNWCGASVCSGTTNIGLDPNNLSTFGKVPVKGGGSSGSGEHNLQLSLCPYFWDLQRVRPEGPVFAWVL